MRLERPNRPRWLMRIAGVVVAWAVIALFLILESMPDVPNTPREWVALLLLGPPVYVGLEVAAEHVFSAKVGARISRARFSLKRIAVLLVVLVGIAAALIWWHFRAMG